MAGEPLWLGDIWSHRLGEATLGREGDMKPAQSRRLQGSRGSMVNQAAVSHIVGSNHTAVLSHSSVDQTSDIDFTGSNKGRAGCVRVQRP